MTNESLTAAYRCSKRLISFSARGLGLPTSLTMASALFHVCISSEIYTHIETYFFYCLSLCNIIHPRRLFDHLDECKSYIRNHLKILESICIQRIAVKSIPYVLHFECCYQSVLSCTAWTQQISYCP